MELMPTSRQSAELTTGGGPDSRCQNAMQIWKNSQSKYPMTGIPISLLNGERELSFNDFKGFLMFLSASYGLDFTNAESPEYKKAEIIFQRCIAKHWSYKEFQERLYDFIDNNKWVNFTPASFLSDYERPSLYGEAWKNAEKGKNMNAIADMECYEIPDENGQIVKLYRYSDPEHPVKNHIDKWAKINTMKAFAAPIDSQPEEIKELPGTINPDIPIDCEIS